MRIEEYGLTEDEIRFIKRIANAFNAQRMTIENILLDKLTCNDIIETRKDITNG